MSSVLFSSPWRVKSKVELLNTYTWFHPQGDGFYFVSFFSCDCLLLVLLLLLLLLCHWHQWLWRLRGWQRWMDSCRVVNQLKWKKKPSPCFYVLAFTYAAAVATAVVTSGWCWCWCWCWCWAISFWLKSACMYTSGWMIHHKFFLPFPPSSFFCCIFAITPYSKSKCACESNDLSENFTSSPSLSLLCSVSDRVALDPKIQFTHVSSSGSGSGSGFALPFLVMAFINGLESFTLQFLMMRAENVTHRLVMLMMMMLTFCLFTLHFSLLLLLLLHTASLHH